MEHHEPARREVARSLSAELADAMRRRWAMLMSLAAESEHELSVVKAVNGDAHRTPATLTDAVSTLVGRLDDWARREVHAIQHALQRIVEGRYGICEACGATIETPRLLAVPTARTCSACARKEAARPDEPGVEVPVPPREKTGDDA